MGNAGICPHTSRMELAVLAESGLQKLSALLKTDEARCLPEVSESDRSGSPVARSGKIVCEGIRDAGADRTTAVTHSTRLGLG